MATAMILLGEIGRPHGVRGLVRVRSFTAEPEDLTAYGPLTDEAGSRRFVLELLSADLARIEGVTDRDQAARLTGTRLYVPRDALPPPEDPEEYYLSDLEGMAAVTPEGQALGRVRAVEDHGAGAFLVLEGPPERLLPFTHAVVPEVNVQARRITVVLPAEVVVEPQPGDSEAGAA
ncbi:ribosome maturation factor RimM [Sediminicoccus sp. KRV36]|uniref:ribosome maturation factor RimM n=1 Tax=Sediminicoccus sp. KRV36 TaxID=3133721 RepID=UPI002010345B|nr:ribosome maturation factor RimM [Sediminicoccus rosea]UPY35539.1 ribosome maturation factor RimM [Sediminicoccus rosea]